MTFTRRLLVAVAATLALTSCTATPRGNPAAPPPPLTSSGVQVNQNTTPVSLTIPGIGVAAEVVPIGLTASRELDITKLDDAPDKVGAYRHSAPGVEVLVGHVSWNGPGVFARLTELRPGDAIEVGWPGGFREKWIVDHVEQVTKARFPAQRVYTDPAGGPLRIITCSGQYDRANRNYLSNFIVFGRPAP